MRDIPLDVGYNSRIDRANRRLIKHSTSERTSICEECGKPFEQVWRPSKGKDGVGEYTHFKTCGACRMAAASGYRKITIPYTPHPAQQKIHDSKARFKLLNCLPPGEIILGVNKAIEDVTVGDRVFGNNGSMNRVYRKIERDYNGQLCKVNARYILPFEVTEEHPILLTKVTRNDNYEAFKKGRRPKKTIWNIGESIWVKACDVQKYLNEQTNYVKWCLKIPRIKSENVADEWAMRELKSCKDYYRPHFPVNNDTAWILGLYLAEGHSTKIGLHFGLGLHETEFIERVKNTFADLGYHVHSSESDIDNSASLTVCSVALGEVFAEKYDRYSHNIGIPDDVLLHHDRDFILKFLRGYFDGDGYLDENKSILYCKTASRKLAMQLQLLIARLGYSAYIHENKRKKSKIRGRYVNNDNPFYMVVCSDYKFIRELGYPAKHKHIREYSFVTDDAIYTPLTSVETRHYSGKVYNLSTDDDTFLVSNIVSHNCGNRFGKDLCSIAEGVMKFLEMENENRSIDVNPPVLWWIVAPSLTYARQNWRDLKKLFPVDLVYKISLSDLTIETINGGIIEVHSADDPESLVGVGLDIVTVTEAPRIRDLDIVWANLRQRLDSPGQVPAVKAV